MTRITIKDARKLGFCNNGLREFAKRLGLDFNRFTEHGIDANEIRHIDDVRVREAIAEAEKREQEERDGK